VDVGDGVEQVVSLVDDDDRVLQLDAQRVAGRFVKQRVVRNDDNLGRRSEWFFDNFRVNPNPLELL